MAVRRSSAKYLILLVLILNFSKCLLSQEIESSTIASEVSNDGVTIGNNVAKDVPIVILDEGGDAPTTVILEEKIVVNHLLKNETEVEKNQDEEKDASEVHVDTSTLKINIQTEPLNAKIPDATDDVLSTGTDKAAIATGDVEAITEKSETPNESTQSSVTPELTTLELQISVTDGQCVCGCNSGDNNNKVECSDNATASSNDDVVIDKRPEEDQTAQASIQEPCAEIGIFPNSIDCKSYYSCTNVSGILQRIEKKCPAKSAFSPTLKRCSRDITSCVDDDIVCIVAGNLPDPRSNTSYYWCADNFSGGLYKYHIECDTSEIFMPEIGKCFIDFQNIGDFGLSFGGPWIGMISPSDRDIVKAEWKLLKAQEKAKAKLLKKQLKYEKKLQEEIEKKAMKERKAKAKQEAKLFVCTEEGNFPSASGQDRYFSCVNKKGKLNAMVMFCGIGYTFDANSQTCVLPSGVAQSVDIHDDDNDDDDDDDD